MKPKNISELLKKYKYVAVYMPEPFNYDYLEFSDTEDNAWNRVKESHLCEICIRELDYGYVELGEEDRIEITHPADTPCGAEWSVLKTEEYFECKSLKELFSKCWGMPIQKRGSNEDS